MIKRLLLFSILLFAALGRGHADELRLQDCLALAREHNSGLKAAQEELTAAAEGTNISRAGLLPSLALEGGYSLLDQSERLIIEGDTFATGIPPQDVEVPVDNQTFYQVDLALKQPLFTGGRLTHAHRQAKLLENKARQQLQRREREIRRDVELAFHEALNARLYTEMLAKAVEAKQERLRTLKALNKEGYADKEALLQQEADLLFAELKRVKGDNREQLAKRRLMQLMNYEGDPEKLRLSGNSFNAALTLSLDESLAAAENYREDLAAAGSEVDILGEEVAIARAGYYPQLSLEGKYSRQKETNLTREDVWSVAAQLEWPLFEWGRTRAEVRQKQAKKRQAVQQRRELTNAVRLEAERAWRSVKEGEASIQAHHKQLISLEFTWRQTAERYAEGKVKLAELIEAEAGLLTAYHEYLMAINDLNAEQANLEAAISRSLELWLVPADIYVPEIDFAAQRARSPLRVVKSGSSSLLAIGVESGLEQRQEQLSEVAVSETGKKAEPPAPYVVQVGSFKDQRYAEDLQKALGMKFPGNSVQITTAGEFHRVRIVGYHSREQAQDAMDHAGISPYLVFKVKDER